MVTIIITGTTAIETTIVVKEAKHAIEEMSMGLSSLRLLITIKLIIIILNMIEASSLTNPNLSNSSLQAECNIMAITLVGHLYLLIY